MVLTKRASRKQQQGGSLNHYPQGKQGSGWINLLKQMSSDRNIHCMLGFKP